jgi:catechol 2,3-dioxygenase-like lactoylglutathione lyase family enzyme
METAIPCLPCASLPEALDFYRALGFEVTYQQSSPYVWAATKRGGFDLHFYGLKGLKPEECHSCCLVAVDDPEPLHKMFSEALRAKLGRLPVAGFPRITRFKPGQTRFTVVDPNGNSVVYLRRDEPEGKDQKLTGLPKALATASRLRDSKNDDAAAAKVLDVALARYLDAPPLDRARALATRAELAVARGEADRLREVRAELGAIPLSDADRMTYRHEFEAADALERSQR